MARISSASLVSTLLFLTGSLGLVDGSSEEETREGGAIAPTSGSSSVVTAFVRATASLTCSLPIDSESVVGWIRKKDKQMLTIGRNLITDDWRFHLVNEFPSDSRLLQIYDVKMEDSGAYECFDASTPTRRHVVHLYLVDPTTKIVGEPTRYVIVGDSLNLTCVIEPSPASEVTVDWIQKTEDWTYHIIDSRHVPSTVMTNNSVRSTFMIYDIEVKDAGNYTCAPSIGSSVATVMVHVVHAQSEVGTDAAEPSTVNVALSGLESGSTLEVTTAGTGRSEENRKLDEYETAETRGLTLAEVQRLAMLKQLRVLAAQEGAIKLQMEVLRLQKENLMCVKEQSLRQAENGHVHKLV